MSGDLSDVELLGRLLALGRQATPERVELLEFDGAKLGRRRMNLRLKRAREDGLIGVAIEGPYGEPWYVLLPKGRKLLGLRERRRDAMSEVTPPSGRRARAHVAPSNRKADGWEVRGKP